MTFAESVALTGFWVAAVPAMGFPLLYFFGSPWRTTIVGKMMMTKSSSIALLFVLTILFMVIPDFPFRDWLVAFAYIYLAVALWFQTIVLLREQRHQRGHHYNRSDVSVSRQHMEDQK